MQHLDEGTIHAWIDGELSPEQASEIETHVAGCRECAAMVAEARGLVAASTRILTALDDVPGGVVPSVPDIAPAQSVRRRWYQRTDLRAAAALLFVAGASLLVTRKGTDTATTRAMIATVDKSQSAPVAGAEKAAAGSAQAAQEVMSDAATTAPVAADKSPQSKARFEAQSSRLQAHDESRLSKEEFAKKSADAANAAPPLFARVGGAAPPPVAAQVEGRSGASVADVVEGRVIDKRNGKGLPQTQVLVEGTAVSVVTDNDGKFKIENIPPGAQRLHVRRIGYDGATIPLAAGARDIAAVEVALAPTQTTLEGVVVTSGAVAPAPAVMLGAAVNKIVPAQPLKVVRADSTGGTKRTIYEVSKGVEVTLTESPVEPVAERDNAMDAAARQKVATPQSSAVPADARQRESLLGGRASGVVAGTSAPSTAINTISWTDRGRKYVLTGRLTTKDLEALKTRLMQMRR
jgi:hypothetical protein